jgi:hypothetical protein
MGLPHMQFTIRSGMIVVAVTAGLIIMCSFWGLLVVLLALPLVAQRRAPSTEFLCALMGMIVGAMFTPDQINNYRPTNDFRDFMLLFCILGGAVTGALVGTIVAWADRRIVSRR